MKKILIIGAEPPRERLALEVYEKIKQDNEVILIGGNNEMNKKLAALAMFGMACLAAPSSNYEDIKRTSERQFKKIIPKGAKLFTFEDGFECFARTQEKADKKHEAWLNKA